MTDVYKGSTSHTYYFELVDSSTGLPKTAIVYTDVTASYVRTRSARVAITPATLASASAAWSSGGFILVDDTNQPGVYRFDIPDAAFATGVDEVIVTVKATGCRTQSRRFTLVNLNNQVAYAPNAAANADGGLPILSSGGTTLGYTISTLTTYTGNTPQTGDAFARIGATGSGLTSLAPSSTALSTATWTATRAGYIDNLSAGAVMLASSYSAPPSAATISAQVASDLATAHGAGSWATATGFSTHSAADVWAVATRVLTAGTNIALAKGIGVTGFNDLSATQVNTEVDTALADYDGPTNAELATALGAADDAVLAAIAEISLTLSPGDITDLANAIASSGLLATETNVNAVKTLATLLSKLAQADQVIDTTATPWALVYYEAGTETELLRKEIKDTDGGNVTSTETIPGRLA